MGESSDSRSKIEIKLHFSRDKLCMIVGFFPICLWLYLHIHANPQSYLSSTKTDRIE